jgi:hypothetical protein
MGLGGMDGENYAERRLAIRWLGAMVSLTPLWFYGIVKTEVVDMPQHMHPTAKRPRISIDVAPDVRRRLRLAAARRDLTVRQYILEALEEQLKEDVGDGEDGLVALTATADPVLAALWVNEKDAAYDRL